MSDTPRIFIAYAHKDAGYLEELRTHLRPLERHNKALVWYDGHIEPGKVWEEAIKNNLHGAHVILLLLSADSINSDYFYEKEMVEALERHEQGTAVVIPLIVRPCVWQETPLEKLQALPKGAKPVSSWPDRDEAWSSAVLSISNLLKSPDMKALMAKKAEAEHLANAKRQQEADEAARQRQAEEEKRQREEEAHLKAEEAERQRRRALDPFYDLMVKIEGGSFEMGDTFSEGYSDEKPVHKVTVKDFHLCKYPVTQAQWKAIMGNPRGDGGPSYFKGEDLPVENINWDEAQAFIKKLNERVIPGGNPYRLPTEAEWEFAARERGKKVRFGNGKDIADPAEINFNGSEKYKQPYSVAGEYRGKTTPVGSLKCPNALGLHDMSGNVWEWCEDAWHEDYKGAPTDGSAWTSGGDQSRRVVRGGSWGSYPGGCRAAYRGRDDPGYRVINRVGFRLAR